MGRGVFQKICPFDFTRVDDRVSGQFCCDNDCATKEQRAPTSAKSMRVLVVKCSFVVNMVAGTAEGRVCKMTCPSPAVCNAVS